MQILISGTNSGLGRYLHECFGSLTWTRQTDESFKQQIQNDGVDTIIHCAFNAQRELAVKNLYRYISDNLLLTERLARIPHRKFIFISTIDVYPKNGKFHAEDEEINPDDIDNFYGIIKLMSEAIIRANCPEFLILRCSALLGKYARKNSLIRILKDDPCKLTLTMDSEFNYVLYEDIEAFIRQAEAHAYKGIYNFVSVGNVKLREIADRLSRKVVFGNFCYKTDPIANEKTVSVFPDLRRSSIETIFAFVQSLNCGRRL